MKTKFIHAEGVPDYLLADGPVEVEIVDIDSEWADYDAINSYIEELQKQWSEEADFYASLAEMSVGRFVE